MRFISWNCNEGFSRKYLHLRSLDFDVAVVTECAPFEPELEGRAVTSEFTLPVSQPGQTKHIGVLARAPWQVEPLARVPSQPWLLPVRITGPVDFTVLAVWALGPDWVEKRLSYAAQTARVVTEVLPAIDGPVVLAGDLNAPVVSAPRDARRHESNVGQLEACGLVSAFTTTRGGQDPLAEPTFYHQRKLDRPFHIDHVFVPEELDEWRRGNGGNLMQTGSRPSSSDHVPIIVDIPSADLPS